MDLKKKGGFARANGFFCLGLVNRPYFLIIDKDLPSKWTLFFFSSLEPFLCLFLRINERGKEKSLFISTVTRYN